MSYTLSILFTLSRVFGFMRFLELIGLYSLEKVLELFSYFRIYMFSIVFRVSGSIGFLELYREIMKNTLLTNYVLMTVDLLLTVNGLTLLGLTSVLGCVLTGDWHGNCYRLRVVA